jgi:protein kinase C substrate 80K-H
VKLARNGKPADIVALTQPQNSVLANRTEGEWKAALGEWPLDITFVHKGAEGARKLHIEAEKMQQDARASFEESQEALKHDYGPDRALFGMRNKCFEKKLGEYNYKICPFNNAKQGGTSLGKFSKVSYNEGGDKGIDAIPADDADLSKLMRGRNMKMDFTKGQKCWNGPDRSATVHFVCGSARDAEIETVDETSPCEYHITMRTPAACDSEVDRLLTGL